MIEDVEELDDELEPSELEEELDPSELLEEEPPELEELEPSELPEDDELEEELEPSELLEEVLLEEEPPELDEELEPSELLEEEEELEPPEELEELAGQVTNVSTRALCTNEIAARPEVIILLHGAAPETPKNTSMSRASPVGISIGTVHVTTPAASAHEVLGAKELPV